MINLKRSEVEVVLSPKGAHDVVKRDEQVAGSCAGG